ncbi:MAG TPA: glycoside hydrolase family 5 protein, partial [Fibrobacteraceae bacterium]|nr:glycoside hydrolase family 5 protein [Fibrobacteraceae bacterium]
MMNLSKFIPISVLLASMVSFAGPVSHFGKIISCGGNLCGEKTGTSVPIQLKGPSLYWSTGDPAVLFHPATVDWFVNNFEIGVIRAPMAIKYYKENSEPISASDGNTGVTSYGYLSTPAGYNEKVNQKKLIKDVVDAAIANDIYVIVDWHSHNASRETNEAVTFFKDMATEYKDVPNLIWEIYNEPVSDDAGAINNYAKSVVAAIRNAGNNNLVVVGTPFYSSQPNQQVSQGLHNTYSNIAYTLHFYAAANHDGYKSNGSSAMSSAPIFITEWGASDASGDGNISDASSWRS